MESINFSSKQWGECEIYFAGQYQDGTPALRVRSIEDGSPIATLTVCVESYADLKEGEFIIKTWSENEPITKELLEKEIFEDTRWRIKAGFVEAQVWRLK